MKSRYLAIFYSVLVFTMLTKSAHAYLDPGTGSYVLQIVAALFLAGTVAIKGFGKQIKDLFQNIFRKGKDSENHSNKK